MTAGPDLALVYDADKSPLAESDHRIANSLAMIAALVRIQAAAVGRGQQLSPQDAQSQLEEAAARIETVAQSHRLLANAGLGGALEPSIFIRDICDMAARAFDSDGRVSLSYEFEESPVLSASRMTTLGLIVNEAMVNALKYAHPAGVNGFINVACRPIYGDSLIVTVEDDGVGLPPHVDHNGGGLGLRIMHSLAEELGGSLSFRSSPLGLTVQVVVPV